MGESAHVAAEILFTVLTFEFSNSALRMESEVSIPDKQIKLFFQQCIKDFWGDMLELVLVGLTSPVSNGVQ